MAVLKIKALPLDYEDATALFRIGIATGIEHHPVTGFQRSLRNEFHEIAAHFLDATCERPALLSETGRDQFLVIDPVHPAGKESARERHFQLVAIFRRRLERAFCESFIDRLAINLADG